MRRCHVAALIAAAAAPTRASAARVSVAVPDAGVTASADAAARDGTVRLHLRNAGAAAARAAVWLPALGITGRAHARDAGTGARVAAGGGTLRLPVPANGSAEVVLTPAPPAGDALLQNWMGQLADVLGHRSLLELTLPGTHDTMTYDLSDTVAAGGIDDYPELAKVLHLFTDVIQLDWIKTQATTQGLTVTEQLDAGARFLDFRIMYTGGDWRCLHMLQTEQTTLTYLQQIHDWLTAHPTEVVVTWYSKHGNNDNPGPSEGQYPGVSAAQKQAFWARVVALFGDMLLNSSVSSLDTPLSTLVQRGHRYVVLAEDWAEFTNSDPRALDAHVWLDNDLCRTNDPVENYKQQMGCFRDAPNRRKNGKWWLCSQSPSPPDGVTGTAVKLQYLNTDTLAWRRSCAAAYGVPNFTASCPSTSLVQSSQLQNFYNQVALDKVPGDTTLGYPHGFYIDGLAPGGLLRTGTTVLHKPDSDFFCDVYRYTNCETDGDPSHCDPGFDLSGEYEHWKTFDVDNGQKEHTLCGLAWQNHYRCCRTPTDGHGLAGWAYSDSVLAYNTRLACAGASPPARCAEVQHTLAQRRAANPMKQWDDLLTGRKAGFPPV